METQGKNQKRLIILIVAAAALAVVVLGAKLVGGGPKFTPEVRHDYWFYDLGSGELFVPSDKGLAGPIPAPSKATQESGAPGGVKALVFACGSCSKPANRFIGILESYSPEAIKAWKELFGDKPFRPTGLSMTDREKAPEGVFDTVLLAAGPPDDPAQRKGWTPKWVSAGSPEADPVRKGPRARCEGKGKLNQCYPDQDGK